MLPPESAAGLHGLPPKSKESVAATVVFSISSGPSLRTLFTRVLTGRLARLAAWLLLALALALAAAALASGWMG